MTSVDCFRWTSSSKSHVGLVRKINEDSCLDQPASGLWVVADGMGGHSGGEVASRMVVNALSEMTTPDSLPAFIAKARERLQAANRRLREEAARRHVRIIGSTVVVLLAFEQRCACLWAGDSRIYRYRDGRLALLTRDHSRTQILAASAEIGAPHLTHKVLTRAVGAADTLSLDEEIVEVDNGDIFLLCSDGLSNAVSENEIGEALLPGKYDQPADALVEMAIERGGRDNISVIVVRVEDLYNADETLLNPAL